ncbi:MAG: transporter suffix domain-containing protein [Proteobacteria bacterium]|nr:transporter suffix domain-containing protein [Pseudomonadota bacterium]
MKKTLGFVLLSVAVLCWIGAPVVPFTPMPHRAAVTASLVVVGEVSFVASIALLGKAYWAKIKSWFQALFVRKR